MELQSNINEKTPDMVAQVSPTVIYALFAAWRPFLFLVFSCLMIFVTPYPYVSGAFAFFWLLIFTYRVLYTSSFKYSISTEQIVYTRGIFSISTDFIELYRIKDYRVRRPFLMRAISVMRLELVTSDKMNPVFVIQGIPNSDLAVQMRKFVELERERKNVYEVD